MEAKYWHNPEYKTSLDKFIIVPIDIDINKSLAQQYDVTSIPNVQLVDINGNVIHKTLATIMQNLLMESSLNFLRIHRIYIRI